MKIQTALILLAFFALTACKLWGTPEQKVDAAGKYVSGSLDFSDEQKQLLKDITEEAKKDLGEEREIRKSQVSNLESLVLAETLDKARIKEYMKQRSVRTEARTEKYLEKMSGLHKTLSPQQKKELLELIQKYTED